MYQTKSPHTKLALSVIIAQANKQDLDSIKSAEIPIELSENLSCFVSIHLLDGNLRGCIGTIEPRHDNLYHEIIHNAISASTKDSRFTPITAKELENINVSVDVIGKPYLVENISELDPFKLGVIVSDGALMRGVLLPNIETIDTVEKQLEIAKRKAGLEDYNNDLLKIYAFSSTRYY